MAFNSNSLNFPNLSVKATPVLADIGLVADSAAGNALSQYTATNRFIPNASITHPKFVSSAVTSAKQDATLINYVKISILAADFKTMHTTPVLILAAQGANKIIQGHAFVWAFAYNSIAYGGPGGTLHLQYTNLTSGTQLDLTTLNATFTAGGTASKYNYNPCTITNSFNYNQTNKGVYTWIDTANFSNGDSNFTAHFWYSVMDVS